MKIKAATLTLCINQKDQCVKLQFNESKPSCSVAHRLMPIKHRGKVARKCHM